MGVIEDVRQVIQDLVAPQLKSLDTRLTSLENHTDQRFASMETTMNQRFAAAEAVAAARYESLVAKLAQLTTVVSANHAAILQELALDKRIRLVEAWLMAHATGPLPQTESQTTESGSLSGS